MNFSFQNKICLHHPNKLTSRSNLQCHCNNNEQSKVHSSLKNFVSIHVPGEFSSLSDLGLFYFLCSISWHWPKFSGAEFRVSFNFLRKQLHFMTSVDTVECGKEQVKTLISMLNSSGQHATKSLLSPKKMQTPLPNHSQNTKTTPTMTTNQPLQWLTLSDSFTNKGSLCTSAVQKQKMRNKETEYCFWTREKKFRAF